MKKPASLGAFLFGLVSVLSNGCGEQEALRGLDLRLEGLSSQAEILHVAIWPERMAQTCATLSMELVQTMESPYQQTWNRSSGATRGFSFSSIPGQSLSITAYAESTEGQVLQYSCQDLSYWDVPSPEVTLRLQDVAQ